MPMAMPPANRAAMNSASTRGSAAPMAEAANSSAETMRIRRRPKRSLSHPAILAPNTQPIKRLLAATSVWTSVRWNWSRRKIMAPLITAMSKPNNSPDVAATMETR